MQNNLMGELIVRCFHARTNAHILHLSTHSYAQHKALNEFYDEIVDLADQLAETYIGLRGLIKSYPGDYRHVADPLKLVTDLYEWIAANRAKCCEKEDTALQSIIDEIVALCASTGYKLRVLK